MSGPLHWGDLVVAGTDRRRALRARNHNGIDTVEVTERGHRLAVTFLEEVPEGLHRDNVRVDGPSGSRVVAVRSVHRVAETGPEREDRLIVTVDGPGSWGSYRLGIVERGPDGRPGSARFHGLDPRFAQIDFVFDVGEPNPVLGAPRTGSPAALLEDISYLGRDYQGLRQLILDRLAVTIPGWTERHVPDIGITLAELFAYVGDELSYYQDAVATEAYLQTARKRISVRRHVRLVDYRMHDGASARAWVCVEVSDAVDLPLDRVGFAALPGPSPTHPAVDVARLPSAMLAGLQRYTPLPAHLGSAASGRHARLRPARNAIALWSWGERDSSLAVGARSAVLVDGPPHAHRGPSARALELRPGDVLVFEETSDPAAPGLAPPDLSHRQAVRLVDVRRLTDDLYRQPLLEVAWAPEDALAFELPVTSDGVACSCARGNALLVGNAVPVVEQVDPARPQLGQPGVTFTAPFPDPAVVAREQARRLRGLYANWRAELESARLDAEHGEPLSRERLKELRRQLGSELIEELCLGDADPELQAWGLGQLLARSGRLLADRRRRLEVLARLAHSSGPLDWLLLAELEDDWGEDLTGSLDPRRPATWGPAAGAMTDDPRRAAAQLRLVDPSVTPPREWLPAPDSLAAAADERRVVAEIDDNGLANLRIGGQPAPGTELTATYQVGNGTAGNAVAEAINAIYSVGDDAGILALVAAVRNPLAAAGGVDPEDPEAVRLAVAGSYLGAQQRALNAGDYARLAASLPGVRRAAAELRWTGAQTVASIAVQPMLGEDPLPAVLDDVALGLEPVRRIDHVLRVGPPRYRPVVIGVEVRLHDATIRADAAASLSSLLSSGWRVDGTPAMFNPAVLGFGQAMYASRIVAALHAVDGVADVSINRFAFADARAPGVAEVLSVGPLEIARLDNDPRIPANGYATVSLVGGR